MHMACMHFHSLSSGRVIFVGPVCDPQNQFGVIGLTGMNQKGKPYHVDTADTVCVQECHVHSNVDDLQVFPLTPAGEVIQPLPPEAWPSLGKDLESACSYPTGENPYFIGSERGALLQCSL